MNHHTHRDDGDCSAREIAWDAAESIRGLNHFTQPSAGLDLAPADIDQVVAALSQAADRLPQLLRQIGEILLHQQQAGLLRVDQASPLPDPAMAVTDATAALQQAAGHASSAGRGLDAAHQILAHLATSTGTGPVVGERGLGGARSTTGRTGVHSPASHVGGEPAYRRGGRPREADRSGGDLSR